MNRHRRSLGYEKVESFNYGQGRKRIPHQRHIKYFQYNHRRKSPKPRERIYLATRGLPSTKQRGPAKKLSTTYDS